MKCLDCGEEECGQVQFSRWLALKTIEEMKNG